MADWKFLLILAGFGLVEFTLSKSPPRGKPLTAIEQLKQFHENEQEKISKESCEKVKKFSEDVLKDTKLKEANTPILQEFRKNITEILNKYETYSQYKLYSDLSLVIAYSTMYNYRKTSDKEVLYIQTLFKNLGYDVITDDYERQVSEIFITKFLHKFEELKEELQKNRKLMTWYREVKSCKDYVCYYVTDNKLLSIINSPKEQFYDGLTRSLVYLYIEYGDKAKNISRNILNDGSLKQVVTPETQEFKRNITQFLEKYTSNQDVYELQHILYSYYNFTSNYHQHYPKSPIANILTRFGSDKLDNEYKREFNKFAEIKFPEQFATFKNQLCPRRRKEEKVLLDWFDHFETLKTFEQRVQAFDVLKTLPTGCQLKLKLLYKCEHD